MIDLITLKQQAGIDHNPDQEGLDLFAQLIVKECVAAIEPGPFLQGTAHDATKGIIDINQRKIKKHFGIEL